MGPMAPVAAAKPKGTVGLWIGAALIVLGIIGGATLAVVGVRSVTKTINEYRRVPANGGGSVIIDEPGTYRVFFERSGTGTGDNLVSVPAIEITSPDGAPVALVGDSTSETYSFGGHDGRKIGRFEALQAGRYRITTPSTSTVPFGAERGAIAVGRKGPVTGLIGAGLGVVGGLALVVLGIIVMIISGIRRSRSKKMAAPMPAGPGAGWGVAPPPAVPHGPEWPGPGWPGPGAGSSPAGAPVAGSAPTGSNPMGEWQGPVSVDPSSLPGWAPPPAPLGWAPPPPPPGWAPPPSPPSDVDGRPAPPDERSTSS